MMTRTIGSPEEGDCPITTSNPLHLADIVSVVHRLECEVVKCLQTMPHAADRWGGELPESLL